MTLRVPQSVAAVQVVDLSVLPFARGGHLLVKHALREVPVGAALRVVGVDDALALHLRAWCRLQGHEWVSADSGGCEIRRGSADTSRWHGAERAGHASASIEGAIVDRPSPRWGLSARGALVDASCPEFHFGITERDQVWTDDAARIYARAVAAQWDPNTAIDWSEPFDLPDAVEDAVVQVMTYLLENEVAALIVPSRFLAQIHPLVREVLQVLAVQAADEARHIEVFTRRATLRRAEPALSTAGGQASLQTLLLEPDFALASFLLSVLGEGTFLSLLWFLAQFGPDPITRRICTLAAQDEARHVAFGLSHLQRHAGLDPTLLERLAMSVERRHQALQHTAGLNEEVFDSLVLLGAGSWEPDAVARGFDAVVSLKEQMDEGRRNRLERLGFSPERASELSSLHTRNFM